MGCFPDSVKIKVTGTCNINRHSRRRFQLTGASPDALGESNAATCAVDPGIFESEMCLVDS